MARGPGKGATASLSEREVEKGNRGDDKYERGGEIQEAALAEVGVKSVWRNAVLVEDFVRDGGHPGVR